jgi:RNA polymerase sigma-70 factor, ECF subfamily
MPRADRQPSPSPSASARAAPKGPGLAELLSRAACGDSEALAAFYDTTHRRTFGLVLRIVGDRATAEEALLDVYEQVWRVAGSFDSGRGAADAWLFQLARTRALDLLRARGRRRRRQADLETTSHAATTLRTPFEHACAAEQSARVKSAVDRLPPAQREAVETAYFGGLSYAEAARSLAVPVGTFKTRMRAALAALRAGALDDDDSERTR